MKTRYKAILAITILPITIALICGFLSWALQCHAPHLGAEVSCKYAPNFIGALLQLPMVVVAFSLPLTILISLIISIVGMANEMFKKK